MYLFIFLAAIQSRQNRKQAVGSLEDIGNEVFFRLLKLNII